MKKIPLTQGKFALVDDSDYEWLNQWKWHFHNGYAVMSGPRGTEKREHILMHREIMKTPNGKQFHLGNFETPKAAAEAYDRVAKEKFGKFARTNFQ